MVRPLKKILITIPRMPYPLNSGGRIAIFDAIKLLSKRYSLTLVIIDDNSSNKIYISELEKFSNHVYFFERSKYRCYFNSIVGLFRNRPLQVGYFYFKDVQKLIKNIYKSHDLFFSFMIRTSLYGINLDINKIHYSIDSMYLNYSNSSKKTTSLLWKFIYRIEISLLYNFEKKHIKSYNATTFVNSEECEFWKRHGNVFTLPHGVDDEIFHYNKVDYTYSNSISFIGRMDYQPNIDAVIWFSKNVIPKLNQRIVFNVIGGFPSNEILKLNSDKIKILGFLHDPYIALNSCICTVAPMQSGGGLQTKILIAMAVNSIVITSSLASKPIKGAKNNINMFIEDNPDKIATIINKIFESPHLYDNIKKDGKSLVYINYSLKAIENKLFDIVDKYII